jgi:hypothetical protein
MTLTLNWQVLKHISAPAFDVFFNARDVTMRLKTSEVPTANEGTPLDTDIFKDLLHQLTAHFFTSQGLRLKMDAYIHLKKRKEAFLTSVMNLQFP